MEKRKSEITPATDAQPVDMTEIKDQIDGYKAQLVDMLVNLKIDPVPYEFAIRLTAETLRERDRAYLEYINGVGNVTRFTSLNSQARACLSMLKLTPVRVYEKADGADSESAV